MKLPEELQFIQNSLLPQKTTSTRMDGKICVVTGATSGIGYRTVLRLAQGGAHIVMVCRNLDKARRIQDELTDQYKAKSDIFIADFKHLSEVSRTAGEIASKFPKINILINNAGVFNKRRRLTPDGNEEMFQVIHLAAFLMTKILIPNLEAGAPSRVIDISSEGHRFGGLNLKDLTWAHRPFIGLRGYAAAKTAQILTTQEYAHRLTGSGVAFNAMHPGAVRTEIGMNNGLLYRLYSRYILHWFLKDPALSAQAIYYLAAAPELERVSGRFFNLTIEEEPAPYTVNDELREKTWAISEDLLAPYLEENHDL